MTNIGFSWGGFSVVSEQSWLFNGQVEDSTGGFFAQLIIIIIIIKKGRQ